MALSIEAAEDGDAANDLLSSLGEAIHMIDDHNSLLISTDANARIAEILAKLVINIDRGQNEDQTSALAALIDFLSSDVIDFLDTGRLDIGKWAGLRQQVQRAWPEAIEAGTIETDPRLV